MEIPYGDLLAQICICNVNVLCVLMCMYFYWLSVVLFVSLISFFVIFCIPAVDLKTILVVENRNFIKPNIFIRILNLCSTFSNCDSLYARLKSHYKVRSYKENRKKKMKSI